MKILVLTEDKYLERWLTLELDEHETFVDPERASESDAIIFDEDKHSLSLSELLDIGRASLYRAFDTLIADGYIEKNGRSIRLLAPDAMIRDYQ